MLWMSALTWSSCSSAPWWNRRPPRARLRSSRVIRALRPAGSAPFAGPAPGAPCAPVPRWRARTAASSTIVSAARASPSATAISAPTASGSASTPSASRPRRTTSARAASSRGSRRHRVDLLRSGALSSKKGFSVVAPMSTINPSSTAGNKTSCCALLKRCTSSRNRIVPRPVSARRRRASSSTPRTSLTPAVTADPGTKTFEVYLAISRARVVLPLPAGPQRIAEPTRSLSMSVRSGAPGATRCCWPTTSSSERGRRRMASGPPVARSRSALALNRSVAADRRDADPGTLPARSVRNHANSQLSEGARWKLRWCSCERIGPGLGLGERDHLPDRLLAGEDRDQSVQADGEARMGRCAKPEGSKQEPESSLGSLLGDPERGEDPTLDVGFVDPDAPGPELPAIEDQVIGECSNPERILLELLEVLRVGHGEWVVRRNGVSRLVDPFEHGEVDDPGKPERTFCDAEAPELGAQRAEHAAGDVLIVGDPQNEVPRAAPGTREDPMALLRGEEALER